MSTATKLITAEEYARMSDIERPSELVRGEIVETPFPYPLHGAACSALGYFAHAADKVSPQMYVLNNVGVLTERRPDTLRRPDVMVVSRSRLSRESLETDPYLTIAPEVVIEVISPWDGWSETQRKIDEFFEIGVLNFCIVDPDTETVQVFESKHLGDRLTADDFLTFPDLLPGFSVPVRAIFE